MKNEQIFREKDKVFHYKYGWGKVVSPHDEECYTRFESKDVVTSKLIPVAELSFTEYNFESGGLSHERPFELEVGKSYKAKYGATLIINRIGKYGNYGFQSGQWTENNPCRHAEQWREATDEEVRDALLEETIRRYGKNWEDVKIKRAIYDVDEDCINMGIYDSGEIDQDPEGWYVCGKNGHLFYKGVWAEKVEEDDRPLYFELEKSSGFDLDGILNENIICNDPESFTEAIKRLFSEKLEEPEFKPFQKVLVRDGQSSAWSIDLFSNMTKSSNFPYRCVGSCWSQCIPYEGNEHLLGTTKSPGT